MTIYYMAGGETRVYHSTMSCPALKTPLRYWFIHEAKGKKAETAIKNRRLRPCKRCPS